MPTTLRNADILFNDGTTLSTSPYPVSDETVRQQIFGVGNTLTVTRNKTYMRRYAYHNSDPSASSNGYVIGSGDTGYQTFAGDYGAYSPDGYTTIESIYARNEVNMTLKSTNVPSKGMRVRVIGNFGQNTDDGSATRIASNLGLLSSEVGWGAGVWSTNGTTVANFVDRQHVVDVDIPNNFLQIGVTFVFAARITGGSGQNESWGIKSTQIQFLQWL